jgi:two-component system, NtrC family, sensor kinase
MQCPRCQHENPTGQKFCGDCGTPLQRPSGTDHPASSYTDVQGSRTEALTRERATSEILRVISSSPSDVQPVFDTIVESVVELCDGVSSTVYQFDGHLIHLVAHHHSVPSAVREVFERVYPLPPSRTSVVAQAILDRALIHVRDFEDDSAIPTASREMARAVGHRSLIVVPMLRGQEPIGAISVGRRGPHGGIRPFTDSEIALLQTFADQAVIAIENARLFNETKEALEQQTATSEVLRAINRAHTDAQPVFDIIAASALRLCGAVFSAMVLYDGEVLRLVAIHNAQPEGAEALRSVFPRPLDEGSATSRAIRSRAVVNIPDVFKDPHFAYGSVARTANYRSVLAVPMMRDGEPVGVILAARPEAGPFSGKETELLRTFADQAVIAIENVRLFKELEVRNRDLSETLEQQVATADILKVISASPTDAQPVFEMIAARAMSLCGADLCLVQRPDGDQVYLAAICGADPASVEVARNSFPMPLSTESLACRAMRGHGIVHVADVLSDPTYELTQQARVMGFRCGLAVSLLRDEQVIGAIYVGRAKTGLFSAKQVELLQTFADQAVIAVENVRLFTELQTSNRELTTALDKQTATSDILSVISRSQTNIQPVFDAIVHSAVRLLGGHTGGLTRVEGDQIVLVALTSVDASADAAVRATFPDSLQSANPHARAVRERMPLNIADAHTDSRLSEATRAYSRTRRFQSWALVPLLRQAEAIGGIGVTRRAPGGFRDDEIALLKTCGYSQNCRRRTGRLRQLMRR